MKSYKISEILYCVIALIATYESYDQWNSNRQKAYIFTGFAILSVFMSLFRRYYRIKFNKRGNSSQ